VVEVVASVGFEVVCFDAEHGVIDNRDVDALVRAADFCAIPSLVRVAAPDAQVMKALDAGAGGIIFPRVDSGADAEHCVRLSRFHPAGERGAGPGRVTGYGPGIAPYVEWAEDNVMVIAQVETVAGLADVDGIAATDGLDGVFIGPGDLAVSLKTTRGSDEHRAAVDRIIEAGLSAGKTVGIFCLPQEVSLWISKGVRLLLVQGDLGLLRAGSQGAFEKAAEERGDR
jgi:4-hydroxy-2-oxoheptanedioate aldolase